jgi:hypothetical protein
MVQSKSSGAASRAATTTTTIVSSTIVKPTSLSHKYATLYCGFDS